MTNRGAAHFRSIKTSCIRYFSVCNFLKDENSLNLPRGSTNSFQLAYFCLIFSRIAKNLFRAISRVLWLWSPVSHWCCKHSWAFKRFSLVLIKSLRMKSLPSSLTLTKASSSNCQLEIRKEKINFYCTFLNPNLNSNCSNLLDLREHAKKAFFCQNSSDLSLFD